VRPYGASLRCCVPTVRPYHASLGMPLRGMVDCYAY